MNDSNSNVAIGSGCMSAMVSGDNNIAIGSYSDSTYKGAMETSTLNINCVAIGTGALQLANHTAADGSIAIGFAALRELAPSSGSQYDDAQTAVGHLSLTSVTSGSGNTALGFQSGYSLTTSNQNTAIGYKALREHVGGGSNTVLGHNAMSQTAGTNAATSAYNVAIGRDALAGDWADATSDSNIAVGCFVMDAVMNDANQNVGIGHGALTELTSGDYNIGIGGTSLDELTTGSYNIAIGYGALHALDGSEAENVAIGYNAANNADGATNNVCIGSNAILSTAAGTNQIEIGKDTTGQADNSVTLGNADVTAVYMASDKGATLYCDKIAVGAGITQHSTTHLDVQGSIRAGCGNAANTTTHSGHLMGISGSTEGDNTVNLLKASMTSEGSLWVISGNQYGTSNRFTDLVLYYNQGVAVVSAQNTGSPDSRTYSVSSEKLFLLINVTDGGEQTYDLRMTGIGGNELSADAAPNVGGTG